MKMRTLAVVVVIAACVAPGAIAAEGEGRKAMEPAKKAYEKDVLKTKDGDLTLTFVGHGTLALAFKGLVIHVDPVAREGDYTRLPKGDVILVTHEHGDHLDPATVAKASKEGAVVVATKACAEALPNAVIMVNGDTREVKGLTIEAVPAYNLKHMRKPGQPFHPKGSGNGYVLTFADLRLYIAGDTENTPEMKALQDIGVAFLPMNLPYTMTPEMVADAAKAFRPRILYPYHFGKTDPKKLVDLLKDEKDIDVRVRDME